MRNRFIKMLLCAGVIPAAVSCISDEFPADDHAGKPGTVCFTLAAPGLSDSRPGTRAMTTTQENTIESVDVLAFSNGGTNSGKLAYHRIASLVSGTTYRAEFPEGTYDLMIIANAASAVQSARLSPQSTTKAQAIAALKLSTLSASKYKWVGTTIPAWGYRNGVTIDDDTSLTGGNAVNMHRMLARIDVQLSKLAASGTENGTGNANFALTEIYLVNYNTVGLIAPDYVGSGYWNPTGGTGANAGKGIAIAPTLPTGGANPAGTQSGMAASSPWAPAQIYTDPGAANDTDGFTKSAVTRTIYTFEATKGVHRTLGDYLKNPCLVIGGKYDESANATYYRVDFVKDGAYLHLLRNHDYTVTVNKVSGPGYDTPKEAFESNTVNMTCDIIDWESGNIGDTGFEGPYFFSVSPGATVLDSAGDETTINVDCDYPEGWSATVWDDEDGTTGQASRQWLKISDDDDPAGSEVTGSDAQQTITLTVGENADIENDRTAYIHITAGRVTLKIKVTQEKAPFQKIYAAPGVVGIKKSALAWLTKLRRKEGMGAYWIPRTEADWKEYTDVKGHPLTIRGSSTYADTWVEDYIADGGRTTEFTSGGYGGLETEPVYVVYFKWGSMVAMIGGGNTSMAGDPWSIDDVVWVNPEFTGTITADTGSASSDSYYGDFSAAPNDGSVNASPGQRDFGTLNKVLGHGDICEEITGSTWRIPTGHPFATTETYMGVNNTTGTTYPFGDYRTAGFQGWGGLRTTNEGVTYWRTASTNTAGTMSGGYSLADHVPIGLSGTEGQAISDNQDLFLPAAGWRNLNGSVEEQGLRGYYWTTTAFSAGGYGMYFFNFGAGPSGSYNYAFGMAVRCVRDE